MKTSRLILLGVTAVCLTLHSTTPAQAAVIPIDNSSFENATGYWAEANGTSSWSQAGNTLTSGGSWNASVYAPGSGLTGYDGNNVLDIQADGGSSGTVTGSAWAGTGSLGIYAADTVYTLTVAVATGQNWALTLNSIVALGTNGADAGSTLVSTTTNFGSLSTTFQDITLTLDTSVVTSAVGQNIAVLLEQNLMLGAAYGRDVQYDNVRLSSSPVPEPATFVMLATGFSMLAMFRRRR